MAGFDQFRLTARGGSWPVLPESLWLFLREKPYATGHVCITPQVPVIRLKRPDRGARDAKRLKKLNELAFRVSRGPLHLTMPGVCEGGRWKHLCNARLIGPAVFVCAHSRAGLFTYNARSLRRRPEEELCLRNFPTGMLWLFRRNPLSPLFPAKAGIQS